MIKELPFKGKNFKISYMETYAIHPTWYTFEDEVDIRQNLWNIQEGDYVLDVGACCGSYTMTALCQGAGFVWAWAPGWVDVHAEVDLLNENVKINNWENICRVYNTGLFDVNGFLDVDSQQLFPTRTHEKQVRVERLDDWATRESPKKVDWLKLDVEGAEVNIFQGGRELIKNFHPKVLVENHLFRRPTIEDEIRAILIKEIGGYREEVTIPYPKHNVSHTLYLPT